MNIMASKNMEEGRETPYGTIPATATASQVHRLNVVATAAADAGALGEAFQGIREVITAGLVKGTLTGGDLEDFLTSLTGHANVALTSVAGDASDAANSLRKVTSLDPEDREGVITDETVAFAEQVLAAWDSRPAVELVLSDKKVRSTSVGEWHIFDHGRHMNARAVPCTLNNVTTFVKTYLEARYGLSYDQTNEGRRQIMKALNSGQQSASYTWTVGDEKVAIQVSTSNLEGRNGDGPAVAPAQQQQQEQPAKV